MSGIGNRLLLRPGALASPSAFAEGLVRSRLLGVDSNPELELLQAALLVTGGREGDVQEAIAFYQQSTSREARGDFIFLIAGLLRDPARRGEIEKALAFLRTPSDREATRFGPSGFVTQQLLAKLRGRRAPQSTLAHVSLSALHHSNQPPARHEIRTPAMLAAGKRFRTEITLRTSLEVE